MRGLQEKYCGGQVKELLQIARAMLRDRRSVPAGPQHLPQRVPTVSEGVAHLPQQSSDATGTADTSAGKLGLRCDSGIAQDDHTFGFHGKDGVDGCDEDQESMECVVCMENLAEVMNLPCGHTVTCQTCALACLKRSPERLLCRSLITGQHTSEQRLRP